MRKNKVMYGGIPSGYIAVIMPAKMVKIEPLTYIYIVDGLIEGMADDVETLAKDLNVSTTDIQRALTKGQQGFVVSDDDEVIEERVQARFLNGWIEVHSTASIDNA